MTIDKVCGYVTDILSFDPAKVIQSRTDYTMIDFNDDVIIVDTLTGEIISKQTAFDGENETQNIDSITSSIFTLDFYGDNAYKNTMTFVNMQSSQLAYDLMKQHELSVWHSTHPRNLKNVSGQSTFERWQIELNITDTIRNEIDLLRIDDAQISIIEN